VIADEAQHTRGEGVRVLQRKLYRCGRLSSNVLTLDFSAGHVQMAHESGFLYLVGDNSNLVHFALVF